MKNLVYLIFSFFWFAFSEDISAQPYPSSEEGYDYPTRTDGTLSPIKVLVVPVVVDPTCSQHGGYSCWPVNNVPTDIDQYFDAVQSSNPTGYFTKYYYDASFGKLIVLGDYLTQPVIIPCGTSMSSVYTVANNLMYNQFGTNLPLAHGSTLNEFDEYDLAIPLRNGYPKIPASNLRFDHIIYLVQGIPGYGPQQGYGCVELETRIGEFHESFESFPRYTFTTGGSGVNWTGSNYFSEGVSCVSSTYSANANGYLEFVLDYLDLATTGSPAATDMSAALVILPAHL